MIVLLLLIIIAILLVGSAVFISWIGIALALIVAVFAIGLASSIWNSLSAFDIWMLALTPIAAILVGGACWFAYKLLIDRPLGSDRNSRRIVEKATREWEEIVAEWEKNNPDRA